MQFLVLLLLLLAALPAAVARQGGQSAQHVRVEGTRVSLIPPAGFTPARRFPGYALEEEGASIMVSELPGQPVQLLPGFSDAARMEARGMTLLSQESAPGAGGTPAVLLGVRQTVAGAVFLKWILVVGDESGTALVTAAFPAASASRFSEPLKRSVLSAHRDHTLTVPTEEGLTYTVAERGALKLTGRMTNMLFFTGSGRVPSPSVDDPLFIAGASLREVEASNGREFAERRVLQTAQLTNIGGLKTEPITVDGLKGFETLADAKDKSTGEPMAVYQVILFEGAQYYLMQGLVSRARADVHLPSFKEMARSFKRK